MIRRPKVNMIFMIPLGALAAQATFSTPNNTMGGTAKMICIFVYAVIFKALIEYLLRRRAEKKNSRADAAKIES